MWKPVLETIALVLCGAIACAWVRPDRAADTGPTLYPVTGRVIFYRTDGLVALDVPVCSPVTRIEHSVQGVWCYTIEYRDAWEGRLHQIDGEFYKTDGWTVHIRQQPKRER